MKMSVIIPLIIAALAGIIGVTSYYYLGPDNPVEEECEVIIKDETGQDVDLTPVKTPSTKPASIQSDVVKPLDTKGV